MYSRHRIKLALAAAAAGFILAGCDDGAQLNRSTPNVRHLTQAEFGGAVTNCPQPVVVDFYAPWCVVCQEMAPAIEQLAGQYAGKVKFVKVNIDESPELAKQYQAEELPVVLIFKDGKPADRLSGESVAADLKSKLAAVAP
jgi:thioredoxin 1